MVFKSDFLKNITLINLLNHIYLFHFNNIQNLNFRNSSSYTTYFLGSDEKSIDIPKEKQN